MIQIHVNIFYHKKLQKCFMYQEVVSLPDKDDNC